MGDEWRPEARGALAAWERVALGLPEWHRQAVGGPRSAAAATPSADITPTAAPAVAGLPRLTPEVLSDLDDPGAHRAALDALMVEAFVRRHALELPAAARDVLSSGAHAVAERLAMRPIISYPLYIRHNPLSPGALRTFTDLPAEERFIRMHRFIEDRFDRLIGRLRQIVHADDRRGRFAESFEAIEELFQRVNRVMAGFRGSERMPHDQFVDGFRPYFDPVVDPDSGEVILDGPSGLQSPTFRIVTMLTGYADEVLDGWTRRIGEYHDVHERERLENALDARDAGNALRAAVAEILPGTPDLPHMHPAYAEHIPMLTRFALQRGYLSSDAVRVIEGSNLDLAAWPAEAPSDTALPAPSSWLDGASETVAAPGKLEELARYAGIEAMLFGFHYEHIATALAHIGHERGTGGTSGVEFLQMALFRRAFPAIWMAPIRGAIEGRWTDG